MLRHVARYDQARRMFLSGFALRVVAQATGLSLKQGRLLQEDLRREGRMAAVRRTPSHKTLIRDGETKRQATLLMQAYATAGGKAVRQTVQVSVLQAAYQVYAATLGGPPVFSLTEAWRLTEALADQRAWFVGCQDCGCRYVEAAQAHGCSGCPFCGGRQRDALGSSVGRTNICISVLPTKDPIPLVGRRNLPKAVDAMQPTTKLVVGRLRPTGALGRAAATYHNVCGRQTPFSLYRAA